MNKEFLFCHSITLTSWIITLGLYKKYQQDRKIKFFFYVFIFYILILYTYIIIILNENNLIIYFEILRFSKNNMTHSFYFNNIIILIYIYVLSFIYILPSDYIFKLIVFLRFLKLFKNINSCAMIETF